MQEFLLFCTMLIITSEAFFQESHGRHTAENLRKKTSDPSHDRSPPDMFRDLNFLEPFAREIPKYQKSVFVPLRSQGFKSEHEKNHALQKNRRFSSRKRSRRKFWKKKTRAPPLPLFVPDSFTFNNPQCFQSDENFVNYFGDSQHDVLTRNPNQYIVCLYPVFNHLKKRTFSRFPNIKRQYLTNLRNIRIKNKRSANDSSAKNETGNRQEFAGGANELANPGIHIPSYFDEKTTGKKNYFDNLSVYKPSYNTHVAEASEKNVGNKKLKENLNFHDSPLKLPFDFDFGSNEHKENPVQKFLPSASDGLGDYDGSLDVTLPPVTIPKFTFKYPYDPQLYESSLRKDRFFPAKSLTKETTVAEEDAAFESFPRDLGKLKLMLEEVESVLKSKVMGKSEKGDKKKKKKDKKEKEKKEKGKKKEKEEENECEEEKINYEESKTTEKLNETITLKEKIDTVAIPILTQISKELGRVANESSCSSSPSSSPSSPSSSSSSPSSYPSAQSDDSKKSDDSNSKKSNIRCSTDGTWTSTGLGFDMTIMTLPNMMLKVKISAKEDTLINTKWSIHGLTLSRRGGPLMLAAIYPQRRKIASFIGQCKICKDQDLIFGAWTIYTCAKRYSDLWKAVETKLDILKRVKT